MLIELKKKNIPKSPTFLLDHLPVLSGIFAIAILISFFFLDEPIARYFYEVPLPQKIWAKWISNIFSPNIYLVLPAVVFFYVRFSLKKEKTSHKIWLFALAFPLSVFLVSILKFLIGRYRPEMLFTKDLFGFDLFTFQNKMGSFPSGTSCNISVLLCGLACFFPRYSYVLLIGAVILAFSRVVVTAHYLSDILAGVYVGMIIVQSVYRIMQKSKISF